MTADCLDEKFVVAVVGKVLGVTAEEYDILKQQAAVDALLHYPDGCTAALEVSSLGPAEEAQVHQSSIDRIPSYSTEPAFPSLARRLFSVDRSRTTGVSDSPQN